MQELGSNQELLAKLVGKNHVRDAFLQHINIGVTAPAQGVSVEVVLTLIRPGSYGRIRLIFSLVQEYSFYWDRQHTFYNVELLKFFRTTEGLYYFCLDPVDESEEQDPNDQSFVLAETVVGYQLPE